MTQLQKLIKYLAMAFAIFLVVSIIGGILSAAGLLGGFLDGDAVGETVETYTVSSDVTSLRIEVNAADLTIKQADAFSVKSNLKHLSVGEENGVLTVRETKKFAGTYNGAVLTVSIPAQTVFQKAEITTGAGRLTVDTLSAGSLRLELGAGEVDIETLTATASANIEGGAGKITIGGGTLCNLDLEMGVGQLNLTSAVLGDSELELGVGESNLTFIGSKADYAVDIEKGIGGITVDGELVSEYESHGNGENTVDINGGVGAVNLVFRENDSTDK